MHTAFRRTGTRKDKKGLVVTEALVTPSSNWSILQPFLAPIERGVEYPPEKYYKGEIPEKAEILQIAAGKSGYFDVEAREVRRIARCLSITSG